MKPKHKKVLVISISVVTVTAILLWYFLPVIAGKWFIYKNTEYLHQLNARPSIIDKLPTSSPDEWENISIDTLSLSLPIHRFNKINVNHDLFSLLSDQEAIVIYDLDPTAEFQQIIETPSKFPINSYEDKFAILNTQPDDISFFKSRKENLNSCINLVRKLISIPISSIDDIIAVNSLNLKAICIMHEKRERGFSATITLYNQRENMTFDITLVGYKTSPMLHSDILNILGSIKMPSQPLNAERVQADIEFISRKYKLIKQTF